MNMNIDANLLKPLHYLLIWNSLLPNEYRIPTEPYAIIQLHFRCRHRDKAMLGSLVSEPI
jgi:hypothetical protein